MPFNINKFRGDGDTVALEEKGASLQAHFNISCAGASADNAASAANSTYWHFQTNRNKYYVWYNVTGTASAGAVLSPQDPTPENGRVGIPVTLSVSQMQAASTIVNATVAALGKLSEIDVVGSAVGFRVTMREFGDVGGSAVVASTIGLNNGLSASVFLSDASNLDGTPRPIVDVAKVILGSAGNATHVIDANGSVYDLDASVYRIADINAGFQGAGSSFTIVASAGDTAVKSNNTVFTHTQRGTIVSSSLGGVV